MPGSRRRVFLRSSSVGLADDASVDSANNLSLFSRLFDGPVIAAGGYTTKMAVDVLQSGLADAVAFGRMFIANPDLPERVRLGAKFNAFDRSTAYGGGERGYTDYPALGEMVAGV
jgi:N-ethylmaleimide reductase